MKIVYKRKRSKPLCLNGDSLFFYSKNKFFMMDLRTFKHDEIGKIDRGFLRNILSRSRIIERILRLEPGFSIYVSDKEILIPIKGALYSFNLDSGSLTIQHKFRPEMRTYLSAVKIENVYGFTDGVYFGEYFNNPDRKEVRIWRRKKVDNSKWEVAHTFENGTINHIHTLLVDKYRDCVWILTGDFDKAAGFWIATDDFRSVEPAVIGKQEYRSCAAFALPKGILYATDTQLEANSIRFLRKVGSIFESEKLYDLEGSCIYSCAVGESYFFSTAVEPASEGKSKLDLISYRRGKGIKSWNSEIVMGNLQEGFKRIAIFEKDILPMGLCQFGTVIFPSIQSNPADLICQGVGLKKIDGKMMIIEYDGNEHE
ncbi:MAG TPA: hypothetical protein PLV00_08130 [Caldisericia bacterium]|nr:hypothetical protein [Caldisericia bacterium]